MQRTKITYNNHAKSNYIQFLLPLVTGTKHNNVRVYKQLPHSTPSTLGGSLSSYPRPVFCPMVKADQGLFNGSKSVGAWC